ncbi:hypothetical protein [Actinomadura sp. 9N215]|uniref:hypothetical protein n=1 Tax=Actinomadura sp. 9N215 TaxID=3375150 RepID=UPI0037A4C767
MNSPQWPGQPPGGPGYPPPAPPGPPLPGGPGFPPPLPPRRGGGSALVPLLIIGVAAVIAVVGVGAYLILESDDDDPRRTSSFPTYPSYTPSSPGYTSEPTPTTSTGGGSDPASILGPTIRTAKGNTFTRAGTRTASCTSRANTTLRTVLRANPCIGVMHSAVYANPSRTIITSVSIAKFTSASSASSVSRVTSDKGWPLLLTPSDASGLPQPRADPAYWTRSWTRGSNVIYAQSYWSSGASTGGRTGSVFATAGELGVEVTNTLIWSD